jgi:hypothetical protein
LPAELETTVREYEPGDEVQIVAAFNKVFAGVDAGFRPRTLEEWRWQFLENPTGWKIYLCVLPDGRVISQYAGVPVPVTIAGERAHFVQAVDSFSDPEFVRGLRRPGPFVVTGYPFAANYGGPPPDRTPVMYGLPVRPAWRIGKKFLEYRLLRTQNKLTRRPESLAPPAAPGIDVEEVSSFPDDAQAVARALAADWTVTTERSPEHLAWRYERRPGVSYRIAVARRGGVPLGYLVVRRTDFDGEEGELMLADWAVPASAEAAGAALLAWAKEVALEEGAPRVTTFLPDTAPGWLALQRAGMRVRPTRYFLVGRYYQRRYQMSWLRRNWYYVPGDTDLV